MTIRLWVITLSTLLLANTALAGYMPAVMLLQHDASQIHSESAPGDSFNSEPVSDRDAQLALAQNLAAESPCHSEARLSLQASQQDTTNHLSSSTQLKNCCDHNCANCLVMTAILSNTFEQASTALTNTFQPLTQTVPPSVGHSLFKPPILESSRG